MSRRSGTRVAVLAAGGTGGHMFPAEALARTLVRRGWTVALATDTRGDQYAQAFPAETRIALNAATFKPGDPVGMIRAGLKIGQGVFQARKAFGALNPAVVVGFGVKNGAHAAAIAQGADGVVVGSALIDALKATLDAEGRATSQSVQAVTTLVNDLAAGIRSVVKQAA